MQNIHFVGSHEKVARILSREWVVEGVLTNAAFTLRPKETYVSVNRPAIATYDSDVASFVIEHPTSPPCRPFSRPSSTAVSVWALSPWEAYSIVQYSSASPCFSRWSSSTAPSSGLWIRFNVPVNVSVIRWSCQP